MRLRRTAGCAIALGLAVTTPVLGQTVIEPESEVPVAGETQLITMDFQDVEIGVLVKFISEITGRNFILDEKVRGKVTVISPTKITIDEAYRVFQSILEVKGFTTVPSGPITKIVPRASAKQSGSPLSSGEAIGDEFVTQLVPLVFVQPSTLLPILQPLVSSDGLVSAYDPTNTILLIDTSNNVDRLLEIIAQLDVEAPEGGIEMIKLENAYAEDVAGKLQEILEASAEANTGAAIGRATARTATTRRTAARARAQATALPAARVIPDERTNSVIVIAQPSQIRMVRALVAELDRELEGIAKINVYRLKYANAAEMVEVLSELIGGSGGSSGGSSRRTTRREQTERSSASRTGAGRRETAAASQASPSSASGGGGEFVDEVRITADPYTNSLIISAAPQDYGTLERVLAELDVPRRQVLVEAIIVEVSLTKSIALGFDLQGGVNLGNDGVALGRVNISALNQALISPGTIPGLFAAAASQQTVTLPDGTTVPAQVALLTALANDSDVNILSAPTILTSDNQEAEIVVAQNVPFIASRATDATNLANTFATVDRQDVGITLRLTPQISEGNVVRLDLYEEVSAVVPNPPVDPAIAGPTTTVRSASTTIVARDNQTVAIGGLISDNIALSESKVPFLGDIPVLGNLFRQQSDQSSKINLLIFLTPRIIYTDDDMTRVARAERDRHRRAIGREFPGSPSLRELDSPSWDGPRPFEADRPTDRAARPRRRRPSGPLIVTPTPGPMERGAPQASGTDLRASADRPEWRPPRATPTPGARPRPAPRDVSTGEQDVRPGSTRFAVLLSFWEDGVPPDNLRTTNGFLLVQYARNGETFFRKGSTYEYSKQGYEAKYRCLEVFSSSEEAFRLFPPGQPSEQLRGSPARWATLPTEDLVAARAGRGSWKRTE